MGIRNNFGIVTLFAPVVNTEIVSLYILSIMLDRRVSQLLIELSNACKIG